MFFAQFDQRDMQSWASPDSGIAAAQTIGLDEEDLGSIEVWAKLAELSMQADSDGIQQGNNGTEDVELWVQEFLGHEDAPGCSQQELLYKQVARPRHTSMSDSVFEAADITAVPQLVLPQQLPGYFKQAPSLLLNRTSSSQPSSTARKLRDQRFLRNRLPSIPEEGHRCYTSI
eukprot:TRINITY_DN4060_c0_g1_i1.p1 TRINITY_DN4060_c0_g1~~TRINITY_DN4060_c0_g1_i1.p1  ORF type:complete len:173 (+),score=41.70 TRINITY_DN4060_c0_g1_i1:110-628(+)